MISTNKGYGIIEILVYIAILGVMSVTVINSFLVVTRSFQATRINGDLLENGQISLNRMAYEIRRAQSVDVAGSTLDATPGALSLESTDSTGTPATIRYTVESGALVQYTAAVRTVLIPNETISVDTLIFRHITTAHGEAVKIEMKLANVTKKTPVYANFYDTIIVQEE